MRIQHNIMAMNAYRNYTGNVSAMQKNLEKLSSGYKINRAGDDAAGLAISEKMRAQITGLETAQKNAKDGISLVQTAEGAMTEVHDMLNRMVELASQSANGTYDNSVDRAQMQKELDQLRSEINRIADSSNFNGIKLLDGSMDSSFKVSNAANLTLKPVEDGQLGKEPQAGIYTIDFSNASISVDAVNGGSVSFNIFGQTLTLGELADGNYDGAAIASSIATQWAASAGTWTTSHGFTLNAEANGSTVTFTMDKAPTKYWDGTKAAATGGQAVTGQFTYTGAASGNNAEQVTVVTKQEAVDNSMTRMYGQAKFTLVKAGAGDPTSTSGGKLAVEDGAAVIIGDETYVFAVGADSKYKGMDNVIDLTDKTATAKDIVETAAERLTTAAQGNGRFKVASDRKSTITITEKEGGVDYSVNNLAGADAKGTLGTQTKLPDGTTDGIKKATADDWAGLVKFGTVDSSVTSNGLTLQIGDTADSFNQLKVSIGDCHTKAMGIADISIADQASAAKAVDAIKNAINYVSDVRGTLGATQNRLDHTMNNLSVMQENIQDAESSIRDVDIAEEMMEYTKNNILIQSAQAMLAQANQVPQGVLQLLQ